MRIKNSRFRFEDGFCPTCGKDLEGPGNVIGYEIPGVYDGVLFWKCNNCNIYHYRFNKPPMRKKQFESYVKEELAKRGLVR